VPIRKKTPPPKTPAKRRAAARKAVVAQAIVKGAPLTHVARELGVSRSTVERDAQSEDVIHIVAQLVTRHTERIESLFQGALQVIEAAYEANRIVLDRLGNECNLGPDHYARLAGAKRFLELAGSGRPTPKPPDASQPRKGVTLAEFEELYHEYQQSQSTGKVQ